MSFAYVGCRTTKKRNEDGSIGEIADIAPITGKTEGSISFPQPLQV